ncbi:MAG: DUF2752 domain-containing protein [Pirellulaceae bacterium]
MSRPTINETWLARFFLIAVATIGLVTWSLQIAPGDVRLVPCPFHSVTGVECPGCGMTRACTAIGQGRPVDAWHHHPLAFGLIMLAVGFALTPTLCRQGWQRLHRVGQILVLSVATMAVFGVWLLRLFN